MSRANLARTLVTIAEPRHRCLAAAPETPTPIHHLEEDPQPTPPLSEKPLEPERRWMPSPPPLKTTRAALSSPAFPRSFPPQ
jgi:hypothetical protein